MSRRYRRRILLALLVGGQITAIGFARSTEALWPVVVPWILSLVAAVGLCTPMPVSARSWRPRLAPPAFDVILVLGITLLAAALRLPNLETLPSGIHGDEGEFGEPALFIVDGRGPAPFGVVFLDDPALYTYLLAPFVALLGPTMEAIRLPSALVGTATIPALYLLVRELSGRRSAAIASFLLATAAVHIHFSRLALNVIEVPLFACLSLWFLVRAIRRRHDSDYLLAGIIGGLGFYFHFGARLIAPILLLLLLAQLAVGRACWRGWLRAIGLAGGGGLLALSPMFAFLSRDPGLFTTHMEDRMIWNQWERLADQYQTLPSDRIGIVWNQVRRTFEAFITLPDPVEGAHFYSFLDVPLLNGIAAPLALVGLALLCFRLGELRGRLVLIWFCIPTVFMSILTDVAGQSHRLLYAVVPAIVAAALLLDQLSLLARRWLPRTTAALAVPLVLVVPLAAGIWDVQRYFQPGVSDRFAPPYTAQARCLEALPPDTLVLVMGGSPISVDHGPSRYLGHALDRRDVPDPAAALPIEAGDRPLVILVHEWNRDALPLIRAAYPTAQAIDVERPPGQRVLTVLATAATGYSAEDLLSRCGSSKGNRISPS